MESISTCWAGATPLSHNAYLASDNSNVVVRGNIFSDGASHGLQARVLGLARNPDRLAEYQRRFRYVLVDDVGAWKAPQLEPVHRRKSLSCVDFGAIWTIKSAIVPCDGIIFL